MKQKFLSCAIALVTLFSFTTVSAQSPKLHSNLTTTDNGLTLTICYDISGLGNITEVTMSLSYDALVSSLCYNPGNGTGTGDGSVPGQNQSFNDVGEEFTVPVHNGRAIGCFTTKKTFTAGKCPNSTWTGVVSDITFSDIQLTVLGKTFKAPNP